MKGLHKPFISRHIEARKQTQPFMDLYSIDIQRLRKTQTDAEFRRILGTMTESLVKEPRGYMEDLIRSAVAEAVRSEIQAILPVLHELANAAKNVKQKQYLTVREVSELIGVSPTTVYRYVYERKIPFIKHYSNLRFHRLDIMKWMDNGKTEVQ